MHSSASSSAVNFMTNFSTDLKKERPLSVRNQTLDRRFDPHPDLIESLNDNSDS